MSVRCISLLLALLTTSQCWALSERQSWEREFNTGQSGDRLLVRNIWGPVTVTAGPPGSMVLRATEVRSARSASDLDRSRQILALQIEQTADGLSLVVPSGEERWWAPLEGCEECRLYLALEIQVPAETSVDLATVMDGDIAVSGITGTVYLENVNGDIRASGLAQCSRVETVNGDISMSFARQPQTACQFQTVNGDLQVGLPGSPRLTLAIATGNGRIISEFDANPVALDLSVEQSRIGNTTRYRVEQPAGLSIGNGGPRFDFRSLNGNVEIFRNE